MKILYYLFEKYCKEEQTQIIMLLVISILINLFQINGISLITAKIIEGVEHSNYGLVFTNFKMFIMVSIVFIILFHVYRLLQNNVISKLKNWVRNEILKIILISNNESLGQLNFSKFNVPTNRIGAAFYMLFNNIFTSLIPNVSFLLIISMYFLYKNILFGTLFLIANIIIFCYFFYNWDDMMNVKNIYEEHTSVHETDLLDIFNNMEKIIYRGESNSEINNYSDKTKTVINKTWNYYNISNNHTLMMICFSYIIIFLSLYYLITLNRNDKIDKTVFITFFTVLLLYREKIGYIIQEFPDYIDYIGRANHVSPIFNDMIDTVNMKESQVHRHVELDFNIITFENVNFKYKSNAAPIFENLNITLHTNNKIIGITGLSGNGKSTFAKLILKLYEYDSGDIYIDGQNIKNIDNEYIRKNITYVNQNSKLFDKKVIDNMLYACSNIDYCGERLKEILKYPKIAQLYKNIDVHTTQSGLLGENLSGGQRQVVNLIGGLIHPSKILILDEPTNALDPELKKEILGLINDFKKNVKCIMIITHDKDMYPLFDETIQI